MKTNNSNPSRVARMKSGLSLENAAKKARVTPQYLLHCEATQSFSWLLANRLSVIYNAPLDVFTKRGAAR